MLVLRPFLDQNSGQTTNVYIGVIIYFFAHCTAIWQELHCKNKFVILAKYLLQMCDYLYYANL